MKLSNIEPRTSNRTRRGQAGQALVESIVALGVLTMGFLGIVSLLSQSLSTYRVIADQYTATYLAGEGIEIVKNMIDQGVIRGDAWGTGLSAGDYEIDHTTDLIANPPGLAGENLRTLGFDDASALYRYGAGQATRFTRLVRIERIGADEIKVVSTVAWTSRGGGVFNVKLEDHFLNWRP